MKPMQPCPSCGEKDKLIDELVAALEAAKEDIEHWGGYASSYHQRKHKLEQNISDEVEKALK